MRSYVVVVKEEHLVSLGDLNTKLRKVLKLGLTRPVRATLMAAMENNSMIEEQYLRVVVIMAYVTFK